MGSNGFFQLNSTFQLRKKVFMVENSECIYISVEKRNFCKKTAVFLIILNYFLYLYIMAVSVLTYNILVRVVFHLVEE